MSPYRILSTSWPKPLSAEAERAWRWFSSDEVLCPDLLRYEQIGAADNLRGRVVRAFFWLMRAWPLTDSR